MENKKAYILCAGGANYDIHSKLLHDAVMGDSNLSHIYASAGGVARNIAANLASLGNSCVLLSAVGNDGFGQAVIKESEKAGIDCSHIFTDDEHPTSVYLDILGPDGDMCLAANDMRILSYLPETYFEEKKDIIKSAGAVVLEANLSEKQLEAICRIASDAKLPVYADAVSGVKCQVLNFVIDKLSFLKPNRMELEKLSGIACENKDDIEKASAKLLSKGLKEIAVTLGADGCYYANCSGESFFAPAIKIDNVVSATGAGDSFMAAFAHARLRGLSPKAAVDFAQKQALTVIQHSGNTL